MSFAQEASPERVAARLGVPWSDDDAGPYDSTTARAASQDRLVLSPRAVAAADILSQRCAAGGWETVRRLTGPEAVRLAPPPRSLFRRRPPPPVTEEDWRTLLLERWDQITYYRPEDFSIWLLALFKERQRGGVTPGRRNHRPIDSSSEFAHSMLFIAGSGH